MEISWIALIARSYQVTDPKGNSEFCFPEILNVTWGKAEESTYGWSWNKNWLFPARSVIKCFVVSPNLEVEKKNCEEIVCFPPARRSFKEHDLITCKSRVHIVDFNELMRFVRSRELVNFEFWPSTRDTFNTIRKRVGVWRCGKMRDGNLESQTIHHFYDLTQYEQFSLLFRINKTTPP